MNKTRIDLGLHNHFQEIRFKLEEHREQIKEIIDDIYMEMIDIVKLVRNIHDFLKFIESANIKIIYRRRCMGGKRCGK